MQNQDDSLNKLLDEEILENSIAKINDCAQQKDAQINFEIEKLTLQISEEYSKIVNDLKQKIARYEQYIPNFSKSSYFILRSKSWFHVLATTKSKMLNFWPP